MEFCQSEKVGTLWEHQCCDVANLIALINLLKFLNKPSELLQKWGVTPTD